MTPAEKEQQLYVPRFVFKRLGYGLSFAIFVALAYALRGVLVPLFLAFLLAYALDPIVERIYRLGVPRVAAALLVMLLLTGLGITLLLVAVPYFIDEFANAASALPTQVAQLRQRLDPWVFDRFNTHLPGSVSDVTRDYGATIRGGLPQVFESVVPAIFGTFNFVVVAAGSLIIPIFALYLLMDFDVIIRRGSVLLPRRWARQIEDVAVEVHGTLGRYVRGQITASLVLAIFYSVGLKLVGIRLGLPIGVITGLFAFVPYIGFGVGLSMALAMAVLDWQGAGVFLGVIAVMMGGQVLDGFLITPRIVGGSVGLKPIEVLLTMMVAATLFGFIGVLLAVPFGAVVKILVTRATRAYLRSNFYRQIPPVATPTPLPGAYYQDAPTSTQPPIP